MPRRFSNRLENLYIVFGCINLIPSVIVSFGMAFSSLAFAFYAVLLAVIPLASGMAFILVKPRLSSGLVLLGCFTILTYLLVVAYSDFKASFRPIPFHIGWFFLNTSLIALAVVRMNHPKTMRELAI